MSGARARFAVDSHKGRETDELMPSDEVCLR